MSQSQSRREFSSLEQPLVRNNVLPAISPGHVAGAVFSSSRDGLISIAAGHSFGRFTYTVSTHIYTVSCPSLGDNIFVNLFTIIFVVRARRRRW